MATNAKADTTATNGTTEVKVTWASVEEHRDIAKMLHREDLTPEEFLDSIRDEDDYIIDTKRIYGKTLASVYYKIKRENIAREKIRAIKKAKATQSATNTDEGGSN